MYSGNPEPADDLSLIMSLKQSHPNRAAEVVSDASRWIKAQFIGAGADFSYTPCESDNPSTFATFSVSKESKGNRLSLHLKVAEVRERPYVFAEVLQEGRTHGSLFPFLADISTEEEKRNLLHYIADFLLA